MADTNKYGNDHYWCFLDSKVGDREIAIWRGPEGQEEIIARASDKYEAKRIVDALLATQNTAVGAAFDKKALAFLDFVKAHCPEPYATRAANALLWTDKEEYKNLISEFPVIYS